MTYLLDTNGVIALLVPQHVDHHRVHHFFARRSFAICPQIQLGTLRFLTRPRTISGKASRACKRRTRLCDCFAGCVTSRGSLSLRILSVVQKECRLSELLDIDNGTTSIWWRSHNNGASWSPLAIRLCKDIFRSWSNLSRERAFCEKVGEEAQTRIPLI